MPKRSPRELKQAVFDAARARATFIASAAAERRALVRRTPREYQEREVAAFDRAARTKADEIHAALERAIADAEAGMVLKAPPSRRPPSAAESGWVSAISNILPSLSPSILAQLLHDAAANQEIGVLGVAVPYSESVLQYRRDFVGDHGLSRAVVEAKQAMVTPEERESAASAEWITRARADARWLDHISRQPSPENALETSLSMQALKGLFPNIGPPSFDGPVQEPERPAPINLDALPLSVAASGDTGSGT